MSLSAGCGHWSARASVGQAIQLYLVLDAVEVRRHERDSALEAREILAPDAGLGLLGDAASDGEQCAAQPFCLGGQPDLRPATVVGRPHPADEAGTLHALQRN